MSGITVFSAAKGINATATVANDATFSTASDTLVDITGMTVNIVTTKQCTILAFASGNIENDSLSESAAFALVIDGTQSDIRHVENRTLNETNSISLNGRKTGVAAGTITVKCQLRRGSAGNASIEGATGNFESNRIIVVAIEE